jgi:hypothetical protein
LISFEFERGEVGTGETVEFAARWRLDSPLPGALFGIKLVPIVAGPGTAEAAAHSDWERLADKLLLVQGFPVLHGLWGLRASPPGTVYEQRGRIMIPSNAPAGDYSVAIASAQSYPPRYERWTDLRDLVQLTVSPRGLPTNKP